MRPLIYEVTRLYRNSNGQLCCVLKITDKGFSTGLITRVLGHRKPDQKIPFGRMKLQCIHSKAHTPTTPLIPASEILILIYSADLSKVLATCSTDGLPLLAQVFQPFHPHPKSGVNEDHPFVDCGLVCATPPR